MCMCVCACKRDASHPHPCRRRFSVVWPQNFCSYPRTPPQIWGLSSLVHTTSGILWVEWLFMMMLLHKKNKRIQEERRRAASSCFRREQEQLESKEKVGGQRAGNMCRQSFEMFALEQDNDTIIRNLNCAALAPYLLPLSFSNINQ